MHEAINNYSVLGKPNTEKQISRSLEISVQIGIIIEISKLVSGREHIQGRYLS